VQQINLTSPNGTIFSEDRKYRYALWRIWSYNPKIMMQIGLNPSKADEFRSDPTITRGINRARYEGYGGFFMANLFAFVSTDPKMLLSEQNTVGALNDYYLQKMIELSQIQICAWGSFKPVSLRSPIVLSMIKEPFCLGINMDGNPKHPLYVSYNMPIIKYLPIKETNKWTTK